MKDDKIQTGLRIPQARYDELKAMADRSGLSINAIILFLVDVGLNSINLGIEESAHAELRIPKRNDEV